MTEPQQIKQHKISPKVPLVLGLLIVVTIGLTRLPAFGSSHATLFLLVQLGLLILGATAYVLGGLLALVIGNSKIFGQIARGR